MPALPPVLAAWQAAGRAFAWRGHDIFFRETGAPDAPALLLVHGFPSASVDWEAVWPALAARYRLIAPDLIGFGFSAKPRHYDYRIADQADLCEALLRHLGVRDYHLLAHDYGDTVAQELLARQAPGRDAPALQSLALLNGGLFPEVHRPLLTQKLLASPAGPLLARLTSRPAFFASMRRIFGPDTPPSPALLEIFWQVLDRHDGRRVLPRLIRYMEERRSHRERWVGALQQARLPVAFIDGAADPISGAHMAARFGELVPQGKLVLLPGIGHYPQCEAPQAVLAAYLAFRDGAGAA